MSESFSIKRALQRQRSLAAPTVPAVMRAPLAGGEFYASWPQHATAAELLAMKGMFASVIDGWVIAANFRQECEEAAEAEYQSWLKGTT